VKVIRVISQMISFCENERRNGKTIGFVPTMGALHPGHLKLVERALKENNIVVSSIFVNPIQFNNPQDLEKYPRNFERDADLLKSTGCQVVFYPLVEEMYPEPQTQVYDFGMLEKVMEGKFRAGHFNGVAIVVKKLFDIVKPDRAYFGEKDFQQLAVIKALVKKENIPVEIVPCSTVREKDGLAMSSRNARLSAAQRKAAPLIYQTLVGAAEKSYNSPLEEVRKWVAETIGANSEMELEYFEISDPDTLLPLNEIIPPRPVVACIAVYVGSIRLIDNIIFNL
jgi:pantoate--beta-alanine ligase